MGLDDAQSLTVAPAVCRLCELHATSMVLLSAWMPSCEMMRLGADRLRIRLSLSLDCIDDLGVDSWELFLERRIHAFEQIERPPRASHPVRGVVGHDVVGVKDRSRRGLKHFVPEAFGPSL